MKCVNGNVRLNPVVIRTTFFGAKAPSFFNLEINLCSDENHFTFPTDNSDNNIDPKTTTFFTLKQIILYYPSGLLHFKQLWTGGTEKKLIRQDKTI